MLEAELLRRRAGLAPVLLPAGLPGGVDPAAAPLPAAAAERWRCACCCTSASPSDAVRAAASTRNSQPARCSAAWVVTRNRIGDFKGGELKHRRQMAGRPMA